MSQKIATMADHGATVRATVGGPPVRGAPLRGRHASVPLRDSDHRGGAATVAPLDPESRSQGTSLEIAPAVDVLSAPVDGAHRVNALQKAECRVTEEAGDIEVRDYVCDSSECGRVKFPFTRISAGAGRRPDVASGAVQRALASLRLAFFARRCPQNRPRPRGRPSGRPAHVERDSGPRSARNEEI